MKENNTYNEELGGKNLPDSLRVNPFFVPKNFFEEQEERILDQIRLERLVGNLNVSDSTNATTSPNIPEEYFETLTDNIFAKIAEQDLKDKVSEAGFSVPNLYFDHLDESIKARIAEENLKSRVPEIHFEVQENYFSTSEDQILAKLSESKLRDQVGTESGFAVPELYFEEAQAEIEGKILTEKLHTEIDKNSFTVPTGYFDNLSAEILAKTTDTTKQETTIITLPSRTNWRKYSAAAAIALIVGVGSYFGFQTNNSNSSTTLLASTEVNLDNVSDEEIISYLAQVSDGADLIHLTEYTSDSNEENIQLDSDIENKEIEEYLNYML